MSKRNIIWKFPKNIDFRIVPEYLNRINELQEKSTVIIDLRETERIHSSFIGFLIFIKQRFESKGGKIIIKISPAITKVFGMLNLLDHFSISPMIINKRQSA